MLIVLIAIGVWSTTGVLIAWGLRRQGHNFWIYAGLGIAYGPIVIALLLDADAGRLPLVKTVQDDNTPSNPEGWIDVLVGHDGDDETNASVQAAIALLGPGIRRLRLAGVLDYEMGAKPRRFPEVSRLEAQLKAAAEQTGRQHVEIVQLSGRPDMALVEHAVDQKFHLVVVAHRQRRLETGLLGSTVDRLARTSNIPILVGPPADAVQPLAAEAPRTDAPAQTP